MPEALAWRARVKDDLRDPRGARADGGRAAEGFEDRLDARIRSRAPEPALAAARADAADARFRRAQVEETLALAADALEDYRTSCDLGRADACDRAAALTPKDAPRVPRPKKRRYQANPADDSGTRIYAN